MQFAAGQIIFDSSVTFADMQNVLNQIKDLNYMGSALLEDKTHQLYFAYKKSWDEQVKPLISQLPKDNKQLQGLLLGFDNLHHIIDCLSNIKECKLKEAVDFEAILIHPPSSNSIDLLAKSILQIGMDLALSSTTLNFWSLSLSLMYYENNYSVETFNTLFLEYLTQIHGQIAFKI